MNWTITEVKYYIYSNHGTQYIYYNHGKVTKLIYTDTVLSLALIIGSTDGTESMADYTIWS